jgi:hypothetical protein
MGNRIASPANVPETSSVASEARSRCFIDPPPEPKPVSEPDSGGPQTKHFAHAAHWHPLCWYPLTLAKAKGADPNRASSGADYPSNIKLLGARIGMTAVLHTWGQNLFHHPHVHCIELRWLLGSETGPSGRSAAFHFVTAPAKAKSRRFVERTGYWRQRCQGGLGEIELDLDLLNTIGVRISRLGSATCCSSAVRA